MLRGVHDKKSSDFGAVTIIENRLIYAAIPEGSRVEEVGIVFSDAAASHPLPTSHLIVRHVFYFCSNPRQSPSHVYLCSDKTLVYEQFFADFGPLNVACICRFTRQLAQLLTDPAHRVGPSMLLGE